MFHGKISKEWKERLDFRVSKDSALGSSFGSSINLAHRGSMSSLYTSDMSRTSSRSGLVTRKSVLIADKDEKHTLTVQGPRFTDFSGPKSCIHAKDGKAGGKLRIEGPAITYDESMKSTNPKDEKTRANAQLQAATKKFDGSETGFKFKSEDSHLCAGNEMKNQFREEGYQPETSFNFKSEDPLLGGRKEEKKLFEEEESMTGINVNDAEAGDNLQLPDATTTFDSSISNPCEVQAENVNSKSEVKEEKNQYEGKDNDEEHTLIVQGAKSTELPGCQLDIANIFAPTVDEETELVLDAETTYIPQTEPPFSYDEKKRSSEECGIKNAKELKVGIYAKDEKTGAEVRLEGATISFDDIDEEHTLIVQGAKSTELSEENILDPRVEVQNVISEGEKRSAISETESQESKTERAQLDLNEATTSEPKSICSQKGVGEQEFKDESAKLPPNLRRAQHSDQLHNQSEVFHDDVIRKEFRAQIGPDGGNIEICDCLVTFPPGSFEEPTLVEGKLEIDPLRWPPGYTPISPMIFIKSETKTKCPITVQLVSWCKNGDSGEGKNMTVDVLHLPDEKPEWEVISTQPFTSETMFRFDSPDYSPFLVAIYEDFTGPVEYLVDCRVHTKPDNDFQLNFNLQNRVIEEHLLKYNPGRLQSGFQTISVRKNDRIAITIKCVEPDGILFVTERFEFVANNDFLRKKYEQFVAHIANEADAPRRLKISCDLLVNGVAVQRDQTFMYTLDIEGGGQKVNLYGDFNVAGNSTLNICPRNVETNNLPVEQHDNHLGRYNEQGTSVSAYFVFIAMLLVLCLFQDATSKIIISVISSAIVMAIFTAICERIYQQFF
uniref:uncharacterized protein LOC120340395 n=1 Tax=Styela clava TaxID=7725 RepID=UPI001939DB25|nr:uncharacterized protein LOC120340395 [Styela clava]